MGYYSQSIIGKREKIKRSLAASRGFPRVMASPPTVSANTSSDASLTVTYGPETKADAFAWYGGFVAQVVSGTTDRVNLASVHLGPGNNGNLGASSNYANYNNTGFLWMVETDAPTMEWITQSSSESLRFLVDELDGLGPLYTSLTPTAITSGGGLRYMRLVFGSRKVRRIALEGALGYNHYGVKVDVKSRIWRPGNDPLRITLTGDSYSANSGGTIARQSYPHTLGRLLGTPAVWIDGAGGTGLIKNNGTIYNYQQRVQVVFDSDPDLYFVQASRNDGGLSNQQSTWETHLRTLRAGLPGVPIFVIGVFYHSTGDANALASEDAAHAAVDAIGDVNMFKIPVLRDPAGAWIFGTGKSGSTTGNGNADNYVHSDGTHYVTDGYDYAARRVAAAAAKIIRAW